MISPQLFAFFDISLYAFNLLSFILGMMFGATMWRTKAMFYVAFYFITLASIYGVKYYMATHNGVLF